MNKKKVSALQQISKMIEGTGKPIDKNVPALEVKDYYKKFGKFTATKNVSFNVEHGVIHGFIGPNGAGKTTTIKAMIGAYVATSGDIFINGNHSGTASANELIGYIPERASFPAHLNTLNYLRSMGQLSGLSGKESIKRASDILDALGLSMHAKRKPSGFSSGMQKKILLAQSLLTDPKILILDEPAANLDPTARKELFEQLIMLRDQGKTIIISSHILSELERLVDEVTFIYYGEIVYSGKTKDLTDGDSDVFIKSENNIELVKYLKTKKYKIMGDLKTEIMIPNLSRKDVNKLFGELNKSKVHIISFRSNDLQSVYDKLLMKSEKDNKGNQSVGKEKTIAMKKVFSKTKSKTTTKKKEVK